MRKIPQKTKPEDKKVMDQNWDRAGKCRTGKCGIKFTSELESKNST